MQVYSFSFTTINSIKGFVESGSTGCELNLQQHLPDELPADDELHVRLGDVYGEEDGGDKGAENGTRQKVGQVGQQRRRPELRGQTLADSLSGKTQHIINISDQDQ